jgi:hypothetical protein
MEKTIMVLRIFGMLFGVVAVQMMAASGIAGAEQKMPSPGYHSERIYSGAYETQGLYVRWSEKKAYMPPQLPADLSNVTCPDALESLTLRGRWEGNLLRNGSCGSTFEPAQWVIGNYLNYLIDGQASASPETSGGN